MQSSFGLRAIVATVIAFASSAVIAQTIPSGIYSMPDSGYSIAIEPRGDDLSVVEAGKQRTYRKAGPGSYQYYSEIMGATYELRYRDRGSVAALKLGSGGGATLLFRQGGPGPEEPKPSTESALVEKPTPPPAPGEPPASPYLAVAEKYQTLALTDKKDVQSWAFCSAAALKRSMATKAEADAYGREAAERLASISVDPGKNPCPDAIPAELWPAPVAADSEALKAANADALAAAARQREEIAAMKAKAAADQAAFERAQAEHRAALARSQAAQEAYAREQAAYKAAAEEYQRQLQAAKPGSKPGK